MKIGTLMVAAQCSGYAGGVPKTDQDVAREGVSGKAAQSGAPAERWETQRSWPGEEVRKWTFRPKEQHTQRQIKREGL